MIAREQTALCRTCASAPGEPCREIGTRRSPLLPSQRPAVRTHLARLHRVLSREARR